MPKFIIHKDGAYNIYSTIIDCPEFESALTIDQLKYVISTEYRDSGLSLLEERLSRAHKKGCSSIIYDNLEQCIKYNRAGKNEKSLSFDDFIKKYLTL